MSKNNNKYARTTSSLPPDVFSGGYKWRRFNVFIVSFEHISHTFLVFLLLLWTSKCLLRSFHCYGNFWAFKRFHFNTFSFRGDHHIHIASQKRHFDDFVSTHSPTFKMSNIKYKKFTKNTNPLMIKDT